MNLVCFTENAIFRQTETGKVENSSTMNMIGDAHTQKCVCCYAIDIEAQKLSFGAPHTSMNRVFPRLCNPAKLSETMRRREADAPFHRVRIYLGRSKARKKISVFRKIVPSSRRLLRHLEVC